MSPHEVAPAGPTTDSLEQFQSDEQRHVLDTIAQIRKCGLDGVLSLPQLVLCGDQSAGKSSVLEALTEIPVPRKDNLCTRFATEFTLRRAASESLSLRIIPDNQRPASEQTSIREFSEVITDFDELPSIMDKALTVLGLDAAFVTVSPRAFARDILSLEIEGPTRPQLTLVDVPGLVQTETKGVTKQDKDMVAEITDFYIRQERTICLAVISAAHDYANQSILTKVREVDPEGERTLGIITKPDKLSPTSGSEAAFLSLARNEDVFFRLGWHVIKNRKFEESGFAIDERNASEATFFRTSNFKTLLADTVGVDALQIRLSGLLTEHVKKELPSLKKDLDSAREQTTLELQALGVERANAQDCRNYLTTLSLRCLEITRAAVDGHYEGDYFQKSVDDQFSPASPWSVRRLRAMIQSLNNSFAQTMRQRGPKFYIHVVNQQERASPTAGDELSTHLSRDETLKWIKRALVRCRGREPIGSYNPLIVGELFWELSSQWSSLAEQHVASVGQVCKTFLETLLQEKCPTDVCSRLKALKVTDALKKRRDAALAELKRLDIDNGDFPAIYNHYFTHAVQKTRHDRVIRTLTTSITEAVEHRPLKGCGSGEHKTARVDVESAVQKLRNDYTHDMEQFSCEEVLDNLLSVYKTQQKVYVANVTTQVVERHMVRGLDKIFSPLDVNGMTDADVLKVASEPSKTKRQRAFLLDRTEKLNQGHEIFRDVMAGV